MGDRTVSCSRGLVVAALLGLGCVARLPADEEGESSGSTGAEPSTSPSTSDAPAATGEGSTTVEGDDGSSSTGEPLPPPPPGGLGPWGYGYVELPEIVADWIDFADVDGDGHLDLLAHRNDDGYRLVTHLGLGDGSFVEDGMWQLPGQHGFLRAGNFDGAPGLDVALFDEYSDDAFTLLLNDGSGRLGAPQVAQVGGFYGFGANPMRDDLDGDDDLFVPGGWGEGATVAVAQGGGAFVQGAAVDSPACYFSSTTVVDFDGDGLDEVIGTGSCNSVPEVLPLVVYRHVGGVLVADQTVVSDLGPVLEGCELAITDADADGDLDVVTATELGLFVLENEGDGVLADPPVMVPHTAEGYTRRVIPLVLEDTPGPAFLLASPFYSSVPSDPPALVVLDPAFTSSATEILELQGRVADAADVDEDGRPDVAVIHGEDDTGPLALWLSGS